MSDLVLPGIDTPLAAPETDQVDTTTSANVDTTDQTESGISTDAVATDEPKEVVSKEARGVQKRINELVAEREEAKRDRSKLQDQLSQVMSHLLKGGQPPQAQPKIDAPPNKADFSDYTDFVVASAEYRALQKFRAEQAQATRQQQELNQRNQQAAKIQQTERAKEQLHGALASQLSEARESYPDYDDVVGNATWELPLNVEAAMTLSGAGGHVAYYLAKNPKLVKQLAALPDMAVAAQMSRIAHYLKPSASVSNAPPPGRPSGSRGSNAGGYRDDFTPEQHIAWEKRQAK